MDRHNGGAGILSRRDGELADQLREVVGPWRVRHGPLPVVVSGMAGSKSGLMEMPYLDCPAGVADLALGLRPIDPETLSECWLVPGLKGHTPENRLDVMRGEEVQIFGLLEQRISGGAASLLILPGTHCKWVLAKGGKVHRFATTISGELYAVLQRLGSLAALVVEGGGTELDRDDFLSAVGEARRPGGLLHHLFGLRVSALLEEFPSNELYARLSALIIGHEIQAMLAMFPGNQTATVIGERTLTSVYCDALELNGIEAIHADPSSAAAVGAARLARMVGIVT